MNGSESRWDSLEQIAPVRVVRGNNDKEWAENLGALWGQAPDL